MSYRVARQLGQDGDERVVHLVSCSLEEASASGNEQRVAGEHNRVKLMVLGGLGKIANVSGCVARREQALDVERAELNRVVVFDLVSESWNPVVPFNSAQKE